ncbi:gliding motility-associated C-terminal domain-containing protein [Flavivirga amylovorans]|uniref:Gliding motility-associated C-terminal domain-containing protein n=1 Tax=Flavivirga amylovorans TaxID=870486 RepID=A0ABT8X1L2_9FLAO|nr:gliding motility-associated C-terminal domain-containing protein [Flavivirga amylovorans]MDO5987489.1 gliding motility-associated C-terminal domain-containing protein [Flavivirga amylovorans]
MKTQILLQLKRYAILLGFISLSSYGQEPIGHPIIGDQDHHGLGETTSLSADGNTVAIGCWSVNQFSNNGTVRVYGKIRDTQSPGGFKWEQIGDTIASETNLGTRKGEEFGRTISLSHNGTVLAIGARGNDGTGTDAGHVRVYRRDALDNWVQIGNDIDGTQAWSLSGFDVSLSGDGNVVAIGAPFFDVNGLSNAGQVRVYRRDTNDNWVQIGSDIEGRSEGERLGVSVSISNDGNTLAMVALHLGSPYTVENRTRWDSKGLITRVYKNDNGTWVQAGDFTGNQGTVTRDDRGGYVRLTRDGNTLAITSAVDGSVRVYKRSANNNDKWPQKGNELKGAFGYGIALSDDANTLVVGTPHVSLNNLLSVGRVSIYKYSSYNTWQLVTDFDGEHRGHLLGSSNSLSLSSDGAVLAMGASDHGFNTTTGYNLLIGRARMYYIGEIGVSIQGAPAAVNTTDPFEVTFTFDRGVTDFNEGDIAVTNATIGNFTVVNASTYTVAVTPISICGDDDDITINIPASSAFDINSNIPNLAAQEVVVNTGVVASAKDITVQLAPNGLATISPEDLNDGSGHNCGHGAALTLSLDRDTFTCSDVGTPVTVTLTATSGNQTDISTAVVTVENNTNNLVAAAKDMTVQLNADGEASISPGEIDNGSGSGCNNTNPISLSLDRNVFTCDDVGMATVVLTAKQGSETATATATVTVEAHLDNLVAIAKDIIVQLDPNGQFTISPEDVDNGSAYGCGNIPELSLDRDTFDCDDVGTPITVTLTATQGNNSDTATAVVTIEEHLDNLVAIAKDITVWLDADRLATISPEDVNDGSNYGCGNIPELSLDRDTFDCDDVGTPITVTLTAEQGSNTATARALVTVEVPLDNLVAIAKDITVQLDASGQATISPEDVNDGSNYGCGNIPELSLDKSTFTCDDVGTPVTVTLTAEQGSNTATAMALVTVETTNNCEDQPLADFNRGFSPNGDGIADTLVIEGLEKYRNNVVKIYNLSQRLLFSAHYGGPGDAWDGTHKGGRVPVGSYVCVIDYNEPELGHETKMIYVNY